MTGNFSMDDAPPPAPTFLIFTYLALISTLFLINHAIVSMNTVLLPLFLISSLNTLVLVFTLLVALDKKGTLINKLFPNFQGLRNTGRDVWLCLEVNPVIFWYSTGETPQTLQVLVDRIYLDVTKPRHLPRIPQTD